MRHTTIAAAVLLALSGSGCTTDDGSAVLIIHNQAPGPDCTTEPSLGNDFLGRGFIDARSSFAYLLTPLVKNEAVTADGLTESQRTAFLEGANVDLSFEAGLFDASALADLDERGLVSFSVDFSGIVRPDNGFTSIAFPILPVPLLVELQGVLPNGDNPSTVVRADIRLFGEFAGGDFETRAFSYPVEVCDHCIAVDNGPCAELPPGFTPRTGGACSALQDPPLGPVDCCTDVVGNLVCPAAATAP